MPTTFLGNSPFPCQTHQWFKLMTCSKHWDPLLLLLYFASGCDYHSFFLQVGISFYLSESSSTATLQTQNGLAVRTILSFWTVFCRDYRWAPSQCDMQFTCDTDQQNPFLKTGVLFHSAILNISPRDAFTQLSGQKIIYTFFYKKK